MLRGLIRTGTRQCNGSSSRKHFHSEALKLLVGRTRGAKKAKLHRTIRVRPAMAQLGSSFFIGVFASDAFPRWYSNPNRGDDAQKDRAKYHVFNEVFYHGVHRNWIVNLA
jgi:hypothetical protein